MTGATMFTAGDLSTLLEAPGAVDAEDAVAVSVFMPADVRGPEIRQGPIRLKNLLATAREALVENGLSPADSDAFLAPAAALVEDYRFWQHQDHGLALFLDRTGLRSHHVPIALDERVVVGSSFYIRPLLPLLAADGSYVVLTLTAGEAKLYRGSRFGLEADEAAALTRSLADVPADPDYENPVQAPPVSRPATGTVDISNAQVYGAAPPEWRKTQLVKFAQRVASDVESLLAGSSIPVVLVAGPELGGHFSQASRLGSRLVEVAEVNPAALDERALHEVAYPAVAPLLDADRREAVDRVAMLLGRGDERVAVEIGDVIRAAAHGRVDVLLLDDAATVPGSYDAATDQVRLGGDGRAGDLLDTAAAQTLRSGGRVHVVTADELPQARPAVAALRY